ncbi:hypothetical protein ACP70R_010260 [Stipagrostis hirtigluma subsp. patula]
MQPTGGRLLSFAYPFIDVLRPEPPPTEAPWSWASFEPTPPFSSTRVTGKDVSYPHHSASTFAFDMERIEWTRLGDWLLPFKGQAYYDGELDAWVGLCH